MTVQCFLQRFSFRVRRLEPAFFLPALLVSALFLAKALAPTALDASEVQIFKADTREALIDGEFDGVSLDPLGVLSLAQRAERLAGIEEPFIFDAAPHPEGFVLGTGNAGKVLLVRSSGEVEELFATEEPEVFAVLTGRDGTVYAGASPYGQIYRLSPGETEPEVLAATGAAYVWDLAEDSEGRLLIATGLAGRLYRVDPSAAVSGGTLAADLLFESPDSHVRSLAVRPDGRVLLGTAGQGLLIELAFEHEKQRGEGDREVARATTLIDAVQPEILGLAVDDAGDVYAAAVATEASLLDLSKTQPPPQASGEDGEATVTVSNQTKDTVGSRPSVYTGPRGVVLRAAVSGEVEEVTSFKEDTIHSLLWHDGALWIGTGQEGRIFRFAANEVVLERDLDESQVVALVPAHDVSEAAAVVTNTAAIYRFPGGYERSGTYTSPVLDAKQVARFGSFLWRGEMPRGAALELEGRSGMSGVPDATWTAWIAAEGSPDGREHSFAEVPAGRFVQWRATLQTSGRADDGPSLRASELSYRQENQRPLIASFEVLAPGEVLVPQNFNPQSQTFEPWSPNREGIFTTLRADGNGDASRLKTLYKKGYRSLRWEASDGNEDELVYELTFQREGGEGSGANAWLPIIEDLDEPYYSFDASVLPDGVYRFRLRVSDRPSASDEEALVAERTSAPVVIDHSAPELVRASRSGGSDDGVVIEAEVRDASSPLRDVVVSVDAGEWRDATALDGLVDGRGESLRIEVPEEARMVLLRVTDASWNVITFDLLAATAGSR